MIVSRNVSRPMRVAVGRRSGFQPRLFPDSRLEAAPTADVRNFIVYAFGMAVAIAALSSATVFAQEADDTQADDSEVIEEIIVFAPKPGDRRRVDEEYEDPVRAQLLKDFYKMKEDQEEYEWRTAAAEENTSNVKWGYDPSDEYRMRMEMELQELPAQRTKPATLFKLSF